MYWYAHIKPCAHSTGMPAKDLVETLARFDGLTRTDGDTWSGTDPEVWFTLTALKTHDPNSWHSTGVLPEQINFVACVGSASGEPEAVLAIFESIAESLGWEFVMEEPWYC